MKINIFIAKRNRDEYLLTTLYYLNMANRQKRHDVEVYVIDDQHLLEIPAYGNIGVTYLHLKTGELFNKSKLFNYGLAHARKDFDWFSIVDIDMVYSPEYFNIVEGRIRLGMDYIVCHGWKLAKPESDMIIANHPAIETIQAMPKTEFIVGPSQLSMTPKIYNLFKDLFGENLYDEFYEGWGAEDSDLSYKSTMLFYKKQLRKDSVNNVWFHLFHESSNNNQTRYDINNKHYQTMTDKICQVVTQKFGV